MVCYALLQAEIPSVFHDEAKSPQTEHLGRYFPSALLRGGSRIRQGGISSAPGKGAVRGAVFRSTFCSGRAVGLLSSIAILSWYIGATRISKNEGNCMNSTSRNSSSINTYFSTTWVLCLSVWGRGRVIQTYSAGLNSFVVQGIKPQFLLSWGGEGDYWYGPASLLS